ncbi:host cell division inhibitor Icd-like protein [Morganella morganii]|uniref:host cell division inhibitor Icd-like protein n=1 Tax=Morganella morganii TaxID=582 RepID=UPI0021D3974B|nr:host cell division inhibitor Icd-like protein [Morganella morganii]MCU6377629.1 host cell division inhibitor Icd-like protein [Morganella morganii]
MTFTSVVFDTPETVYQSANINQLTPDGVDIASQGKGSLLDGSVPVQSAKFYTDQSPKFTGNQSGEYSSGYKSADILRYSNLSHSKGGGITLFKGFIRGTVRGDIEFSDSIKKGSVSPPLCVFDIKYRANQPLQSSQWLKPGKQNISGESKNFDDNHLFLSSDVRYSDRAPAKSGVRIETLKQLSATHDAPCVFFCVRAHAHLKNTVLCRPDSMVTLAGQPSGWLDSDNSSSLNPVSVTTPIEIETSGGDSISKLSEIIVMMATPAQTHPKFKWRFFSCQQSRYFTVEARSEQEARSMQPDAPCLFSARVRQEVRHA